MEALLVSGRSSSSVTDSAFAFECGLHIPLCQGSIPTDRRSRMFRIRTSRARQAQLLDAQVRQVVAQAQLIREGGRP